jgi:hypothetical protein
MSYTDLRDFEAEFTTEIDDLTIRIEKLGGGTVGNAYTGTWRYVVTTRDGIEVARGQNLETGMPHTHAEVADMVAENFVPTGTWEIGQNLTGSPREASETFHSWADAADRVREMMRDYADDDDQSRDDDDESTRADVDAALSPLDGVGPERCEDAAWSLSIENRSYHRVEFWIQPAS